MNPYESHRARLIISADDFGISPRANRNILYLITLGKINRVGVMTRGIITPKEIEQLNRSGVKIDIHLDVLHEFDQQRKNRKSTGARCFEFLGKILTGELSKAAVEKDWREQIEIFKQMFGRGPDGISSHEHVHFFPPFFKIALKLQEEYHIPYIRFGESTGRRYDSAIAFILRVLRRINMRACRKATCVSSTTLISLDWLVDMDKFLDNPPEGTVEIACHPEVAEDFVKIKKYL